MAGNESAHSFVGDYNSYEVQGKGGEGFTQICILSSFVIHDRVSPCYSAVVFSLWIVRDQTVSEIYAEIPRSRWRNGETDCLLSSEERMGCAALRSGELRSLCTFVNAVSIY